MLCFLETQRKEPAPVVCSWTRLHFLAFFFFFFFGVLEAKSLHCSQNVLNGFVFLHCCFPLFLGRNVSTVCLETGCRPATGFSLPRGKVTQTPYLFIFIFFLVKHKSITQIYNLSRFHPQIMQNPFSPVAVIFLMKMCTLSVSSLFSTLLRITGLITSMRRAVRKKI